MTAGSSESYIGVTGRSEFFSAGNPTGLGGGIIVQNITIAELQAHLGYL